MIGLTDEEFLEWCGEHRVVGCGGTRVMEGVDRAVSICEDCRAKAQLKKVYEWLRDDYSLDIVGSAWEEIEQALLEEIK